MWFLNPNITFQDVLMRILASVIIIFTVLPLHEYAHGWVAGKLGDKTAKYSGRLSMNPLDHVDPLGALGILLFGFGWAKPVPVDPRNFKNPKSGMAITAIAGPISNLLAAFVGAVLLRLLILISGILPISIFVGAATFFRYYIMINIGIAVFNLIPLPPLDGSKILEAFLPDRIIYKYAQYQGIISLVLLALVLLGVLSVPLSYLQYYIYTGMMHIVGL